MSRYAALTAFYGGTFDPIHYGHLHPVISLTNFINFNQVILLPNNIPPHRPMPVASAKHRLAMVRLAIDNLPHSLFTIDTREMQSITPSYTIDTFKILRHEYGPHMPLALIIGHDSLLTLPQWHRGLELLNLCHLLVCARPWYNNYKLNSYLCNKWFIRKLTNDPKLLYKQPAGFIYYANTPRLAISASEIRARYKIGLNCDGLLPLSVQNYINSNKLLYR